MSGRYPLLRSLDPHQQRIGYLGPLVQVGVRALDTAEALSARLHDLLFERIYPDDPRFEALRSMISDDKWNELLKNRTGMSQDEDLSSILSPSEDKPGWYYISELWLHDNVLPSSLGMVWSQYVERTVQLGRWTNLLLPTYELSEVGVILQLLLNDARKEGSERNFNPLNPRIRPAVQLLFARIVLQSEVLFPFLIKEMLERTQTAKPLMTRGKDGLLSATVERVLNSIGDQRDPEELFELSDLFDFRKSLDRSLSTQENYLRPRLEILVDLGFIDRKNDRGKSRNDFRWLTNSRTAIVATQWNELTNDCAKTPEYLETRFFGSMAAIYGRRLNPPKGIDEMIFWFVRAFEKIGREFGFTPGRTVATLACLMAWEDGIVMELHDVFEAVLQTDELPIGRYFHFSGGSRFDREFLVRIDRQAAGEMIEKIEPTKEGN